MQDSELSYFLILFSLFFCILVPTVKPRSRTIFQRAIEASELTWQDPHLQCILGTGCQHSHRPTSSSHFNSQGQALWQGWYHRLDVAISIVQPNVVAFLCLNIAPGYLTSYIHLVHCVTSGDASTVISFFLEIDPI